MLRNPFELHGRRVQAPFRFVALVIALGGLNACGAYQGKQADTPQRAFTHTVHAEQTVRKVADTSFVSLTENSTLGRLAHSIAEYSHTRSSAEAELQASASARTALNYERYPTVSPSASVPLTGGGANSAKVGVSVSQLLWDFGELRARMDGADALVVGNTIRSWNDQNRAVFDGTVAFVEMARIESQIRLNTTLEERLGELDVLLEAREQGGVAPKGERLRLAVARQEVQRQTVEDQNDLDRSRRTLLRLLPAGASLPPPPTVARTTDMCRRSWPDGREGPVALVAFVDLLRAEADERSVRGRRFPRLVLQATASPGSNGRIQTGAGLQIDASRMLGLGRKHELDAASSRIDAARTAYDRAKEDEAADVQQLQAEYGSLKQARARVETLVRQNEAIIEAYQDQVDAGTAPLSEGVRVFREATSARRSLLKIDADIAKNCLRISRLRGTLSRFE